jgi:hypothetical protein
MSARGSTTLPQRSAAQGFRDGFAGKKPRYDDDEYMTSYAEGADDWRRIGSWLAQIGKKGNTATPANAARKQWNGGDPEHARAGSA